MSNAPRLQSNRQWGSDDSRTPILHVDMDSFFASVELVENPVLRGSPVVVGGVSNRGVVTSATYEARAKGVRSGQPILKARQLCPEATFLPVRMDLYRQYSRKVMAILGEITPMVEQISIDEAFLDVSGSRLRLGSPTQIGALIRQRIRAEVGIPASVGVAATKSVAKIASAGAKPDGMLLIPEAATIEFLHSLPVGSLWGVGGRTEQRLRERGIDTVADLAHTDLKFLTKLLGQAAAHSLHSLAWGIDKRSVGPAPAEKSISVERTFDVNLTSRQQVEAYLLWAAEQCAVRLRRGDWAAWTVHLKVRDASFRTMSRSLTLTVPTDLAKYIAQAAKRMFAEVTVPAGGFRLVGVGVSGLVSREAGVPVTLDDDPRDGRAERAVDEVRAKFGAGALLRARLMEQADSNGEQGS